MIKQFQIFNFDHTFEQPMELAIHPFTVKIEKTHCDTIKKIPKGRYNVYSHELINNDIVPIINKVPEVEGGWVNTAYIEIDEENILPSTIYFTNSDKNIVHDFCLFLSFLTGRRVCIEEEKRFYTPDVYFNRVIDQSDLFFRLREYWDKFSQIANKKLESQFYNMVLAYEANEMIAKFAYANSSYDMAYSKWHKENKFRYTGLNKKTLNKIKDNISDYIKKSILIDVKKKMVEFLISEKAGCEFIEDVEKRIGDKLHEKTHYLMKFFLRELDIYPEIDSEEINQRLVLFGRVRNAFVHSGSLFFNSDFDENTRAQVSGAIVDIILSVLQIYFSKKIFNIDSYSIREASRRVREYFEIGKYGGHDIFNESYDEYMEKFEYYYMLYGELYYQ